MGGNIMTFKALLIATTACLGGQAMAQTLTIWDWKSGDPVAASYFDAVREAFAAAHPGVTLNFVNQPIDQYYTLLGTALASGQGPDVFLLNGGAQARARMDALTDLTPQAEGLVGLTEFQDADGAVRALPISIQGFVVYYNKDRYSEAGLDPEAPPQTWAELASACEAINAAGAVPCFALGNKEGYGAEFFLSSVGASMLSEQAQQQFATGDLTWSSPEITAILQAWVDTQGMGWYQPGANSTAKFMDEYEMFMRGDAANTIGLLSDVAHWKQFEDFLGAESIGAFRHPAPEMIADHAMIPVAGGIGYGVNAAGGNVDLATALVETLASAGPIQVFVNDAGVVPANTAVDTSGLASPTAGTILGWLDSSGVTMAHANVTAEELAEWHRQSQLLLNGETTVEAAAARMDDVQKAAHGG